MALEMKQSLKLAQQLVMTPQLQQAIKLLQLSRMELLEEVQQEMLENPVLEEAQDGETPEDEISGIDAIEQDVGALENVAPDKDAAADETLTANVDDGPVTDIDWDTYLENYYSSEGDYYAAQEEEESSFEQYTSKKTTLYEHLIWQLRLSNFTFDEEQVGIHIIGNLDEDGYLRATLEEIAEATDARPELVEQTLAKAQKFDPVGVAARDLRECLLIQMRHWGMDGDVLEKILTDHFPLLEKRDVKALSRAIKKPIEEIQGAIKVIASLEPRPGRAFSDDRAEYITPDIFVHKVGDEYVVVLNEDGLPRLKVSSYYRNVLKGEGKTGDLTKGYIREKLRSAMWLIKSIHQRQRTIYKVMKSIVAFQKEFFDKGIGALEPLILKDVANDIGMHESTVSRVTNNKYVHTPQGIFELKYFFNSSVGTTEGGTIAAESVKQKIRKIVANEKPEKPYSDQEITGMLRDMDIEIARRTVTKYRESINILSSAKRKKCF